MSRKPLEVLRDAFKDKFKRWVILAVVAVLLIVSLTIAIRLSDGLAFHAESKVSDFGLKDIGELATQSGFFTVVNVIDDSKKIGNWSVPFTSSKYIFSYDGVIKAGIDFAEIEWTLDEPTKTIKILLPEPKIISRLLDEDSLKIYDERNNIFTPLSLGDIQNSRQEMLAEIEETARKNGLLEEAGENAKVLIKGFLGAIYDPTEYTYTFE